MGEVMIGLIGVIAFGCLAAAVYGWVQRLRRPPAAHGQLTDGDKVVIVILVLVIWPAALVYWLHAADKADALAASKSNANP